MRKLAIALLTTTVISAPAFAASSGPQQPQANQTQSQSANKQSSNAQTQQPGPNTQQADRQTAQNQSNDQTMSPQNLPRREIRQVQQALDKDGFNAGRPDGRWGPETNGALKKFQQRKQLAASGQLDQQTITDLGLDTTRFAPQQKGSNSNR